MCAAVLDGVLTQQQAAVLTRLVGKIDPDALAESQPNLIAVAATMDPAQLGHWVSHQIATHCEPVFEAEQERAHAKRYLTHRRDDDGSLFGRFRLAAEDSEAFLTALEPLARRNRDLDTRTAGQRRADALVVMSEQVLRHGELGDAGGLRPQLSYVLPADWAAARNAEATCTACGPRCADHQPLTFTDTVTAAMPGQGGIRAEQACATAAWTGPQTRARIETLLCDARITRVLLSPLGQVTGFQPLRDSVTPAQRRNLAARDLGCAVRGCTRPPAMCDAHHVRPAPTAARRPWTIWSCSAEDTTSCGTKESSSSTTSTSRGTRSRPPHHQDPSTTSSTGPDHDACRAGRPAGTARSRQDVRDGATGRRRPVRGRPARPAACP